MPDLVQQEQLERAANAFDDLTEERGWGERPLLLRLEHGLDPEAGAELGVKELDAHPGQALLGFSAPIAWTAIGVSAEGWATPCVDADHGYRAEAPEGAPRARVRSLVIMTSNGLVAGRLRRQDGGILSEAPAEGLIVDCLRRALGRCTSPPVASTATLFATCWLENVGARAKGTGRPVSWTNVVALHPAVQALARSGRVVKPGELVTAAATFARLCDWTMVRHQIIAGWRPVDIDPRVAVWMDSGMLSRWLLDQASSIDELEAALHAVCPPVVLQRIRRSLDQMGVTTARTVPDDQQPAVA